MFNFMVVKGKQVVCKLVLVTNFLFSLLWNSDFGHQSYAKIDINRAMNASP